MTGAGTVATPAVRMAVRLLGAFSVKVEGDERASSLPARSGLLLAHLLVDAGLPRPRQQLAFHLWPDSTEGQARTNLRNVVYHIRRTAPDLAGLVEVSATHLRWVGGPGCSVDLVALRDALDAADAAAADSPARLDAWRAAVALYSGDLLSGVDDEWLDGERGRLRARFLGAARDLTEALIADRRREAVDAARELVRHEPLDEVHHRLLVEAHAGAGDRAGAVRAYHACVEILGRELDLAPSAETRGAYQRLLDQGPAAERAATVAPSRASGAHATALVGRAHEMGVIDSRWDDATAGRAQLVVVHGEAGVGKTRLVEELAVEVARRGAAVARGRAYESEGGLGYGMVVSWLRSPDVAGRLQAAPRTDRTELARLLPELGVDGPGRRPVDEGDRIRLFEAVARALTAGDRPLLLVADDAQWCDAASLQFTHYLVRSAGASLLVVATARPEGMAEDHPLMATTRGLQALDRATAVGLDRLDPDETGVLAEALGVADLDGPAVERLHAETEGNPLFVVEAVRAGWDARSARVDLSPKLQAVIAARLALLSPDARLVLAAGATAGRDFTTGLVGRATGLGELPLVRALDELWWRGVIEGSGPDGYDFTHAKIREAAYEALSPALRRHHHLRIAEALLESGDGDAASSGSIASHLDRAGRAGDAIEWYQRAAQRAIEIGAPAEAVRVLDRARELAAQAGGPDSLLVERRLLGMLPAALGGVDGYASERLAAVQRRSLDLARRLGEEPEPAMLRSLVMTRLCQDDYDEADAAAGRLLAAGVASGDHGLEIESIYLLGIVAFWAGRLADAAAHFEDVVARFDLRRDPDHLVRFGQDPRPVCLSRLANTLWFQGRPDEALAARDEALGLVAGLDEFVTSEVVHIFGAVLSIDAGDREGFRAFASHFADGRDRSGLHLLVAEVLLGYADVLDGRADRGRSRIEASIAEMGGRNRAPGSLAMLHRVLAAAQAEAGDAAGGLDATDRALALGGTRLWEPDVRALRARFLAGVGAPAGDVAAELDRAAVAARRLGTTGSATAVVTARAALLGP